MGSRDVVSNILKKSGYVAPQFRKYNVTVGKTTYKNISYECKRAVDENRPDKYKPINDDEKNLIAAVKKKNTAMKEGVLSKNLAYQAGKKIKESQMSIGDLRRNENENQNKSVKQSKQKNNQITSIGQLKQDDQKKQNENKALSILSKYNINKDTFDMKDYTTWAKEHNFQLVRKGAKGHYSEYEPKRANGGFGKKLTTTEEEEDNRILRKLAENNQSKKDPLFKHADVGYTITKVSAGATGAVENALNFVEGGVDWTLSKVMGALGFKNASDYLKKSSADNLSRTTYGEQASQYADEEYKPGKVAKFLGPTFESAAHAPGSFIPHGVFFLDSV